MGIVFGVYRNWIWEFGDLRSYTPILWGSIWPNTIISDPIFIFFPWLHRIWNPNTMDSRTIVFEGFDLKCRRVPLKIDKVTMCLIAVNHLTSSSHQSGEGCPRHRAL